MKKPSIIQGTAKHRSALKEIKSLEQRKAEVQPASTASSPAKQKAYGGTKTWAEGQESLGGKKGDATTGLNKVVNEQRAYEKKMKDKDAKWKKREDI